MRRVYLAGAVGNIIEWYDFVLFGYFAPVFAQLFFSTQSKWLGLVIVYGIFATSFLARPIGGFIYGHIGDRWGRKKALVLSVSLMTGLSLLLGLLPTQQTLGILAPILLIIVRVLQGLAAGGEVSGSFVYVLESSASNKRGLLGGATWGTVVIGMLLGSAIAAFLQAFLSTPAFNSWGWRLAYYLGALMGIAGLLLRTYMPESREFSAAVSSQQLERFPLKTTFKSHKLLLVKLISLIALPAAGFYLPFLYLPVFASQSLHIPEAKVLAVNAIVQVLLVLMMIGFGGLSDYLGRKKIIISGMLCTLFFSYLLLCVLTKNGLIVFFIVQLLFAILVASMEGPLPALMVETIPVQVRYSIMAISYNVSFAVFGGFAPLISTVLIKWTNNHLAPSYYLMVSAIISLFAILSLKTSHLKK